MSEQTALIYIGNGAWLPDVPARDLTAAEVEKHGGEAKLLESGLYASPDKQPKSSKRGEK